MLALALAFTCIMLPSRGYADGEAHYTEPQITTVRPGTKGKHPLGPIGVTGIEARIYDGLQITVEGTEKGTPADGKFVAGEVITGVNGTTLKGKNPLVALGRALTEAEAGGGKLTFDVTEPESGRSRLVAITVPTPGPYSPTWPVDCRKSACIVKRAAAYYASEYPRLRNGDHHLLNGLACIFLLSTGDDQYLPRVKAYLTQFLEADGTAKDVAGNSWHDGPNGVATAEYYLRTGDRTVLPLLQHYVDDARDRQRYGVGWGHWGGNASPRYEGGGGMQHWAGNWILLTLTLGKACGVDVDDDTLLGALRHWYRFVGHGGIPIADQRNFAAEYGSSGRDGLTAAVMHVASRADGDTTIYKKAREYLAMSTLTFLPNGYFAIVGQSLGMGFMLDQDPDLYHMTMRQAGWMYDLGRTASGGFWLPQVHDSVESMGAGLALALAYTAPLKNLYLNGATSDHAIPFSLPEHLWGTEADLAFLNAHHHPDFFKYGEEDPFHLPFFTEDSLPNGLRYYPAHYKNYPLETALKYVHHKQYTVRSGAAKVLQFNGHYDELEKLLRSPDPRLRRAALDGIIDCRPWFAGSPVFWHPLPTENYTPGMRDAITDILNNPEESWHVTEGALLALHNAPPELIEKNLSRVLAWKDHAEWWLRDAAFHALLGFRNDEEKFVRHLPVINDIVISEYPYNPRHRMVNMLKKELEKREPDSPAYQLIVAGQIRAAKESEVLPDIRNYNRSLDGQVNILEAVWAVMEQAPASAAEMAAALEASGRLSSLQLDALMDVIDGKDGNRPIGLYPAREKVAARDRERLEDLLYNAYRPELVARYESARTREKNRLLNMILDLTALKQEGAGWQEVGSPPHAERGWRYRSFEPFVESEKMHPRIGAPQRALRELTLPDDMEGWNRVAFDDSAWEQGKAPIGKGVFKPIGKASRSAEDRDFHYPNRSEWGEGEFLFMRTTFELNEEEVNKAYYRLRILSPQGYAIYLNGRRIHTYAWFDGMPRYSEVLLGPDNNKVFRKGGNVLAARGNLRYDEVSQGQYDEIGQMDIYLEALDKKDLGLE